MPPAEFGPWNSVYARFASWQENGVRQRLMDRLAADADLGWLMPAGTVMRAHGSAAGAKRAKGMRVSDGHGAGSPRSCTTPPAASATRSASCPTDWHLEEERARIDGPFGKREHLRRIFGRLDELARRHLAFVPPAAAEILPR
jgi:transposase